MQREWRIDHLRHDDELRMEHLKQLLLVSIFAAAVCLFVEFGDGLTEPTVAGQARDGEGETPKPVPKRPCDGKLCDSLLCVHGTVY